MGDISALLANSAVTNADLDLGKLNKSYWEGQEQAAKQDLREAFKGGVPLTPDGQPDFGAMAKVLFQKGGLAEGTAASNLDLTRQQLKFGQGQSDEMRRVESGQPASNIGPPSASRGASVTSTPSAGRAAQPDSVPQPPAARSPQGDQPGSVVGLVSAAGVPDELAGPIIQQVSAITRTDPNAAVNPQLLPRVQQIVAEAVRRSQGGQQPVPAQQPQQPQQPALAPPQAVQPQPAPVTDRLTTAAPAEPSRAEKLISYYMGVMSNPMSPKQNVEAAKVRLEALQKSAELTPEQKMYSQAVLQGFKGTLKDFIEESESGKAGATERAKADVKEQQEYILNGRNAQARLGTLNTITNVVNSDKNLSLGFGSETTLKIKMALEQAGFDFGDLSGAQLIQKLNGVLASESSKSFSSRPTQFEFKTFLQNNPGLALDEKGNVRMLGILAQTAKREADLGKLARQNQDNWQNWDNVVEAYDKKNPIKDPTTGKVLSNHSIIAPVGPGGKQPAGTQRFASPGDVTAAVKAGKLKSGDSFQDSNGTTRYVP